MKLIVLCAVLGVALSNPAPDATAFASASTSYKYDLPGGYASFSSHTPYAAAHVLPVVPVEKSSDSEDKKEYEKPEEAAPYSFPFLKDYPMEDGKIPIVYTQPFPYKPEYYVQSAFGQATPDKVKEETKYESNDKTEEKKMEFKAPVIYTHPFVYNVDPSGKPDEKKQVFYYPYAFPGFKPADSSDKSDEKKQILYYPYAFPGFKPADFSDKSDEKKQVYYYYPSAFPTTSFKFDSSDKSDDKKQVYYYNPFTFPTADPSDKSDEKKPFYFYPYTFPTGYKFDSADKADDKKPFYYSFPSTYKYDFSPSYFPKTETTYKLPVHSPQYYYYHTY